MVKSGNPVDTVPKLVKLLQPLESIDRRRAIQAALMVMGETSIDVPRGGGGTQGGGDAAGGVRGPSAATPRASGNMAENAYFLAKNPRGKVEELAVAARYREEHSNASSSSKADIQTTIKNARRNFDASHYDRDMSNAKRKGFFTTGGSARNAHTLSYYGQQYVDALPDRTAAKALRGAKKRSRPKKHKTSKK